MSPPDICIKTTERAYSTKVFWSNADFFHASIHATGIAAIFFRDYYSPTRHGHEFVEVNIVLRGRGRHFLDGKSFDVKPGDVYIIPPHTLHAYEGRDLDIFHLLIAGPFLARHGSHLFLIPGFLSLFGIEPRFGVDDDFRYGLRLKGKHLEKVTGLLVEIYSGLRGGWGRQVASEGLVLHLIAYFCDIYTAKTISREAAPEIPLRSRSLQRVVVHVEKHYAEKLTLGGLAQVAGMSSNHLGRLFHRAFGLTPLDFIQQHRLHVAQTLLLDPDKKVTEVALETGFYDGAHFSRCFSRNVGLSPLQFRKKARTAYSAGLSLGVGT